MRASVVLGLAAWLALAMACAGRAAEVCALVYVGPPAFPALQAGQLCVDTATATLCVPITRSYSCLSHGVPAPALDYEVSSVNVPLSRLQRESLAGFPVEVRAKVTRAFAPTESAESSPLLVPLPPLTILDVVRQQRTEAGH